MTKPRIAIDGYNLALEQGTGVATYSRVLSQALGALGAEVGVLYGLRGASGRDELGREVGLLDAAPRNPRGFSRTVADALNLFKLRRGITGDPPRPRIPHAQRRPAVERA